MIRFRFVWFSENSLSSDFPFFFFLFPALEQHQGPWHWLIPFRHTNSPSIVLISWFIDYFIYSFPREFIPGFFFHSRFRPVGWLLNFFSPPSLFKQQQKKKKKERKKIADVRRTKKLNESKLNHLDLMFGKCLVLQVVFPRPRSPHL